MIQVKTHFVNSHHYYNFKQTLIVIFCEQYKYLYMLVTWYFVILLTFVIKLVTLWLLYIQFKKKISSTLLVNQYIQNVLKCVKLKCKHNILWWRMQNYGEGHQKQKHTINSDDTNYSLHFIHRLLTSSYTQANWLNLISCLQC